jgi:acetyltransferase-like isoleucine patch superfamily enzyme
VSTRKTGIRKRSRPLAETGREFFAHPQALIDDGAVIGRGTRVWAFAHVLPGATIGAGCNICDACFIETGATIGDDVTVKVGVAVWEGVHVGNGVFLGPYCVFTNDRVPRSFLRRQKADWLEETWLDEGCTIGANATIVCGHRIGRFAFVSAGAVVTADVPDYAMVAGVPARFVSWVCRCGTALRLSRNVAVCKTCGSRYIHSKGRLAPESLLRASTR